MWGVLKKEKKKKKKRMWGLIFFETFVKEIFASMARVFNEKSH